MGLFNKTKIDQLPNFDDVGAPVVESKPVSKEVELITSIKDEFAVVIGGILRQSQKKLVDTNNNLGEVEGQLHNVKIYQTSLKEKADLLESKLLYMRGGRPETVDQDLSEEEQNVIMFLKGIPNHLTSVILELRDLRRLLSKVSVVPTDPQAPPLESGREFGMKVVELVHKVERDLKSMNENVVKIYELENQVETVAKEHGIDFNPQQTAAPAQQIPPQ